MTITRQSARGVPVTITVEQKVSGRGMVIGADSTLSVQYGDGGRGRIFVCADTARNAPEWRRAFALFVADKYLSGRRRPRTKR